MSPSPQPASETAGLGRLDALLPPEMARRGEEIGVQKASLDVLSTLTLAILAGAFIALGGVFATTALAGSGQAPWGQARVLAGVVFSLGLILVTVGGAELFTGNNLIVMAWASGRITLGALARNWALVFAGNFVGASATAVLVFVAGTHRTGGGAFGVAALRPRNPLLAVLAGSAGIKLLRTDGHVVGDFHTLTKWPWLVSAPPDGRKLLFVDGPDSSEWAIFVGDVRSGHAYQLTQRSG